MLLELLFQRDLLSSDTLRAGLYRWERRGRVPVPVSVEWGLPRDPDTGTVLDRSLRWIVQINGNSLEVFARSQFMEPEQVLAEFWPRSAGNTIEPEEYDYLVDTVEHAREHDAYSPFASRSGRIDLLSATIPTVGD